MLKQYSKKNIILMFLFFSHIGWVWEMIITLVFTGQLVKRGFMHGPWLPVYGIGVIFIILINDTKRDKMLFIFLKSAVICTLLEYMTSLVMEVMFSMRWWDYEGRLLNINGRICLFSFLLFGVAGCIVMHIAVFLQMFFAVKLNEIKQKIICCMAGGVFCMDYLVSLISPNIGDGICFPCSQIFF